MRRADARHGPGPSVPAREDTGPATERKEHYLVSLTGVFLMLAARRWLPAFFTTGTLPPLTPVHYAPAPAASRSAQTAGPGAAAPAAAALEAV